MWRKTSSNTVALGLNPVPFAGIAFLWFIGVLRDRLGEFEDRFFSTVFLGSGFLFLAMLFASAEKFSWHSEKSFRFALKPVTIGRLASFDRPVFAGATLDQNH